MTTPDSSPEVATMLSGLSAFPLTPLCEDAVDEASLRALVRRIIDAGTDSITVLGSTGSYAYLSAKERADVVRIAVEEAGRVPVAAGIGGLRTSQVLAHAEAAQLAGAQALLLAPMSYQPLTTVDVYGLFETVSAEASAPLILYDNPGTTGFTFTAELYGQIAHLPGVASVKIPPVPADPTEARGRIEEVRTALPEHVTLGVSGDPSAAAALCAGADTWYSVIGGTLPGPAVDIVRAAREGRSSHAEELSEQFKPLWKLFAQHGSLRVVAAVAEQLGMVSRPSLPLPLRGLDEEAREQVTRALCQIERAGVAL